MYPQSLHRARYLVIHNYGNSNNSTIKQNNCESDMVLSDSDRLMGDSDMLLSDSYRLLS